MGNYLRLVCSVFFGIFYQRWDFPKREFLKSVLLPKEKTLMTTTGHLYSQRILLALGVLGKWGSVLGCIQVVVHSRNISSGTAPGTAVKTFIWDLLSPKFKVKLQLHLIFLFFLGNKSCDWDPTKNSPQARGVPATQVLLTLLLLPNTENTPVLSSHVKKRIIPKILLQLRWVLGIS